MTAGSGIQHTEMFPLLHRDRENPLELFQIWLNLPASDKFVDPYYTMLWKEDIPVISYRDSSGHETKITLIAGSLENMKAPSPPPESWAAKPGHDVVIMLIRMEPRATYKLPAAKEGIERSIYFYKGNSMSINKSGIPSYQAVHLEKGSAIELENGDEESYLLLLQAAPIQETVVQHGPFVMNSRQEIMRAFEDYRQTEFGGWPWSRPDQVHDRNMGRFAKYADGKTENR